MAYLRALALAHGHSTAEVDAMPVSDLELIERYVSGHTQKYTHG